MGPVATSSTTETMRNTNLKSTDAAHDKPEEEDDEEEESSLERSDYNPEDRIYSIEKLKAFDLLVHPVWVFDFVKCQMLWSNHAAVALWNAKSLEELQNRSFRDISAASIKRMEYYLSKAKKGINVTDQWTLYPNGKVKTVHLTVSGIKLSADDDHYSLLFEGMPIANSALLNENLRGVEMLRHLPMAVCQFDMNGKVLFQNPEALMSKEQDEHKDEGDDTSSLATENSELNSIDADENSSSSSSAGGGAMPHRRRKRTGDLVSRFVDPEIGNQILRDIQSPIQTKVDLEATIHTHSGKKWSAIQVRKVNDPITGDPVILYSARDKSDAVQARKERQAREQKSEFLAIMAHEIRTPLHQVMGFIDLLDQTSLDTEQKSYVKLLKSSARGLMTVISDVLDYSKLEAGKMKLEYIPYEPLSVVEGSMAVVRTDCEDKGLYLNLDWNKKTPFKLMGDPNRLRQILLNLLSNAVKFTKIGGITVQAFPTMFAVESCNGESADSSTSPNKNKRPNSKPMVKFIVKDTGMGIKAEHMEVIFRKYQQADVSVARNFGGTGLGLSICQILVQHMGGSIGVESVWGEGASFWFVLPADVPKESDSVEVVTEEATDDDGGLRVLVAEDNRVNQKLVSKMLKRMGHHASIAMNGKEAIEMIEKEEYDVVLMDIQMPVMDGLEATRRLRTLGYTELPIFGLTASVARSNFEDLGFNDWIAKPIPMQDLKAKLYRLKKSRLVSTGQS